MHCRSNSKSHLYRIKKCISQNNTLSEYFARCFYVKEKKFQKSFSFYDSGSHDDPLATGNYFLDTPVVWKRLFEDQAIKVRGRLLGGCLDVLISMIGTRFDCVKEFLQDFREDGIIWYFDNCELSSESLIRALWQLKEARWFKETRAMLFGRSMTNRSYYGISFEQAL